MKRFVVILFGIFLSAISYADTCTQSQIDLGNGECVDTKFSVTTTNLSAGDEFRFLLSAQGTFYVDCGDDGVLSSSADPTDVNGKTITRNDLTEITYTCTYDDGGVKTIRFSGNATGYNTSSQIYTTIQFYGGTPELVYSVDGCLTDIFSKFNDNHYSRPGFKNVFRGCVNLTHIPAGLFSGRIASLSYGFAYCTSLTTIPDGLLNNVDCGFAWCFASMFIGDSALTHVPNKLFANMHVGLLAFYQTFRDCTSLTTIPGDLFANTTTNGYGVFQMTFWNATSLTAIPDGLFDSITRPDSSMFKGTFQGCKSIRYIPPNLFANITSPAQNMFQETFLSCSGLSDYIPPSMFAGLIANNSPTATDMWLDTFRNTNIVTTCPAGTTQYTTGYESEWGRVSCIEDAPHVCSAGEYLPKLYNSCTICSSGSACVGGTYSFNTTSDQGIQSCASGTFSPTGSAVCYPHILHVGDSNVYLKSTKQTTPSLNFRIGNDIFYANMTTTRTKMNKDSEHYFHAQWENNDYYICDDTTCPQ